MPIGSGLHASPAAHPSARVSSLSER
jgi:hypothetical protein